MNWANIPYEDLGFPTFLLQRGVDKLIKYGMPTFMKYAQEAGLSYCDINRIIGKSRMAGGKTELKEIPCPPEMRQKRWECYTDIYCYSENDARQLIKLIDSTYYGSQPIPESSDIRRLAGGIGQFHRGGYND